ncbi:MAG: enoyl-CoA hydratase/isomerase family protein [Burkholderiaceae bacterium]|nr:enoyl-CoA hydratase/isomerase family protein [Burkholderiaceae bacterium]
MADEVALRVERDGAVLRITVNRPARHNPLSRPVLAALHAALTAHAGDDALRCVQVTGAGNRYFAAGGDVHELDALRTPEQAREMSDEGRAALDAVREFPVPVLAVLNGDALGGGAELALACDFRLMREGAHIGFVHGRLAITSAWGGGPDLTSLVGPARALRMTSRCELVSAATALGWGLADVCSPDEATLEAAVRDFVAPMLRQSRHALHACTLQARAMRRGLPQAERRQIEQRHFVDAWVHADHWAAVDRFLQRKETPT